MLSIFTAFLALFTLTMAAPQVANSRTSTGTGVATATASSVSLPTTGCVSDNFVSPWIISNVRIVTPAAGDTSPTDISFAFQDPNEDLMLITECAGMVDENGDADQETGGYLPCQAPEVRFKLQDDKTILVSRWYKDPCKGKAPYDSGIAFGQADADFKVMDPTNGGSSMKWQQRMEINVTRMT